MDDKLYLKSGSTAHDPFELVVTPERAGWGYSGLKVLALGPGHEHTWLTGDDELLVLPLQGSAVVTVEDETFELEGRRSVFDRVSDFCYVPRDAAVTVAAANGGRFALPSARCASRRPARYGPAGDVPVELRGAGQASRQVNNFCSPEAFACDKLIAVEVLTPGGNWSSYPPHKHDEAREGEEAELEEIYYFESRGLAYQRVYGPGVDVLAEVATGDVVLIPHGWHGPSMAAPGYDLYYLNVMAGPAAERAWLFCDDPAHAWIRGTWPGQQIDPRLPMTSAGER
ncbi:MAG: 5-deoxy-glucuronate isomerase [Actinobacteria bacterium]|nr:5-deoxy-glucuronate isomerase [Actinomycetota bacterium]